MVKRYILVVFMLSAAALHGMDVADETSDPRTKVEWSSDGKRIVASHVQISCDGHYGDYTTVIKNVATGTFAEAAWRSMFGVAGGANMQQNAERTRIEKLKAAIAEFEQKK